MKDNLFFRLLRRKLSKVAVALVTLSIYSCRDVSQDTIEPTVISKEAETYAPDVAVKWAELDLMLTQNSPGFTPPVASRALGYAGIALYEAVVPGIKGNRSLVKQLNGLTELPVPEATQEYNWAASANAAQIYMAKNLWPTANEATKKKIDSLGTAIRNDLITGSSQAIVERSEAFGYAIGKAIWDWSKTDGGHEGFNRNFPSTFKVPVFPGSWQPTENGQTIPMQPYWGQNRTFLAANALLIPPSPLAVSTQISSPYFQQYYDVYKKNISLTQNEKEIAVWWADDPSETFTPPGHSYNIAKIAVKTGNIKLDKAVEAFARTGIAVADAFIICWKYKYTFHNERPYTFVRRAIDPNWVPFWPAPPFPGYASGHATQSSASAVALEGIFGTSFAFVDDSHVKRGKDTKRNVEFKARSFKSFQEAASESAYSRFLGGIHTFQDNDTGLKEGKKIGVNINTLAWKK